jgi:rhamnose utilization protein RhaD (predicted bifunctional aldolase and dehydrogenase)
VRLEPLRELVGLQALSDEDMVNVQRCNLLDSKSPNPSVETLLHAFLPHKFIDHTHSNAVLALTDQPDGEALAADVYGKRAALVPYVMPGFALAKKTNEIARESPDVEGLILLKHGIFSMGATAEEAYVRMIDLVTLAEKRLAKATR